jgi:NAD(P)-dependent dehydrogenase (short-subunit alcohol dehydrogenase family)
LAGKVAIVTGAGSIGEGWGNGKATAALFAREGARIMAVDINAAAARETAEIITSEGGECAVCECDVSDSDQVEAMVAACAETYGRVDILHNNVGIAELGGPVAASEESWDRVMDINLKSVFLTCKYVLPQMIEQQSGAIVNIASIAGIRWLGVPYASYSASKAAIIQLTQSVAVEHASQNIRCNSILPGLMDTPMARHSVLKGYSEGDVEEMAAIRARQVPMGKQGDAWDVAYAALFLASDEAKYVTGAQLVVDGGFTCSTVSP